MSRAKIQIQIFRVTHLLANLGWVDLDFGCSALCLVLPGLMGNWQNWLSSWARWWNIPNQSQPIPVSPGDLSPCRYFQKYLYLTSKHCCSLFLPLDVHVAVLWSDHLHFSFLFWSAWKNSLDQLIRPALIMTTWYRVTLVVCDLVGLT